jgi:hypothetical protein
MKNKKISLIDMAILFIGCAIASMAIFAKGVNIYTKISFFIISIPMLIIGLFAGSHNHLCINIEKFVEHWFYDFFTVYSVTASIGICQSMFTNEAKDYPYFILGMSCFTFAMAIYNSTMKMLKMYRYQQFLKNDIHDFIVGFLGAIVAFTQIYCYIFVYFKNSFCGVDSTSGFSIYTDLCLFTVQTFSLQSIADISPTSIQSKIVCILEMLFFAFFVVIVILNIISNNRFNNGGQQ